MEVKAGWGLCSRAALLIRVWGVGRTGFSGALCVPVLHAVTADKVSFLLEVKVTNNVRDTNKLKDNVRLFSVKQGSDEGW
jgi:hypothetical protein